MACSIVICGTVAIDNIFGHEKSITPYFYNTSTDVKVNFVANYCTRYFGGTAANVAYALSLLNMRSKIMASAGSDFHEYKSFLTKHDINTDWIVELSSELTSICVIFRDEEDNHIDIFFPGPMHYDKNLSLVGKNIDDIRLVIITPTDATAMIMRTKECCNLGLPYMFDPGLFIEHLDISDLVFSCANASVLIMNEKEFQRLLNYTKLCLDEILKLSPTVVITNGKNGSTLYHAGKVTNIAVVNSKEVIDTVGAGDAYKAGLAFGMMYELPMVDCCKIGSTISSFEIECHGSMNYTLTPEAFIERYRQHFDNATYIESIFEKHFT